MRFLLGMRGLQGDAQAACGRLLRILLLRIGGVLSAKGEHRILLLRLSIMSRKHIKIAVVAAVILGFAALVVYQFTGGHEYSTNIADVKRDFNRDKGKVRLVTLLSPT